MTTALPVFDRVRIYEVVRTAHLERAHSFIPASILFSHRRYDFDPQLAEGLDLIECSLPKMVLVLLRQQTSTLEVNEPLMRSGLPRAVAAVVAVRVRGLLHRQPTRVVSYAIANLNGFDRPRLGPRSQLRKVCDRILLKLLIRNLDRLAFGTAASRDLYREFLGHDLDDVEQSLIPAVSTPCDCTWQPTEPKTAIFVGALDDRKGVVELMAAWPQARKGINNARLMIVGKGPHAREVADFAARTPGVQFVEDPPRDVIHQQLRRAAVLVLPSKRTPLWREQVGLPIVEGLAHGCSIVTTDESGLADWLNQHGHSVIPAAHLARDLATQLSGALQSGRAASDVLADLPPVDGRQQADEWLFSTDCAAGQ